MENENKPDLSSTELGALWLTYHKKTLILRMLEYFIQHAEDQQSESLMSDLHNELLQKVNKIKTLFENEGASVPIGFTEKDVNLKAPKLWDHGFNVMFSRVLKEISVGMYVLHLTMSYRKDVIELYEELFRMSGTYYRYFTDYLIGKNLLSCPNYVNMPKSADYITDKDYAKGTDILGDKRTINTVEYGYLYHGMETNVIGMKLMEGFVQTTKDEDLKKYFEKGRKIAKEQVEDINKKLFDENIQSPLMPAGTLGSSTEAPFSDKLMIFCNYLLTGLQMGAAGFGTGFSMRNDLQAKNAVFGKDIFQYQREGVQLMMSDRKSVV